MPLFSLDHLSFGCLNSHVAVKSFANFQTHFCETSMHQTFENYMYKLALLNTLSNYQVKILKNKSKHKGKVQCLQFLAARTQLVMKIL